MSRALFALLLVIAGCSRPHDPSPPANPRGGAAAPTAPTEPRAAPAERSVSPPQEASFRTDDGVTIHGTLYPAADRSAPAVILVHQLGSSRGEWAAVIEALREEPTLTVFAIDLRGHGESTEGPDGAISYGGFDTAAWAALEQDVRGAIRHLRSEESWLLPSRVALVGSSIGATAVIRTAARDPNLDVIAVLSPGRAYHGVDAILAATELGPRAFLALASREELDCVETAEALARITSGRTELYDGAAHGVAMLDGHEERTALLVSFLRDALARPRVEPAAAEEAPAPDDPPASPAGGEATH